MINALLDAASAEKVSDLNRSVANLMLKKLDLGMQRTLPALLSQTHGPAKKIANVP